jgi:Protein of unknown function (DUF4239)
MTMLGWRADILVLLVILTATFLLLLALNRFWPVARRSMHNELIGWQLGTLGTIYAVILGFMLFTVWSNFSAAGLNVEMEANAARNLFRIAEGMPQPQREQIERLTRQYVKAVIEDDWPQMEHGEVPEISHGINQKLWRTLMSTKEVTAAQSIAEDHALAALSELTEHRRTRLLQNVSSLPGILWCVLLVGGGLTVVSVTMFGAADVRLHTIQLFSLTILITLIVLAIADLDRPFQGWVHVSEYSFQRAEQNLTELD